MRSEGHRGARRGLGDRVTHPLARGRHGRPVTEVVVVVADRERGLRGAGEVAGGKLGRAHGEPACALLLAHADGGLQVLCPRRISARQGRGALPQACGGQAQVEQRGARVVLERRGVDGVEAGGHVKE